MRLIDADVLKEKLKPCEADVCEFSCEGCHFRVVTAEDIDNAPAVETTKAEHKAYNEGFKDGTDQGIRLSERPKGKWVIVSDEKYGDNVKCPFCDKEIAGTDLNFCVKCGADMRGENKFQDLVVFDDQPKRQLEDPDCHNEL